MPVPPFCYLLANRGLTSRHPFSASEIARASGGLKNIENKLSFPG